MAIFCLADSLSDLKRRLGNIIVGQTRDRAFVTAAQLEAPGAMTALLRDAFAPNLVQTIENNPAIIHGGPFANIAHGCNSVVATKTALKLADYVVTEAGFGADLGAEKFFDIKCRKAGLEPACAVVVATIRALKMHGGVGKDALKTENVFALELGFCQSFTSRGKPQKVWRSGHRCGESIQFGYRCRARKAGPAMRRDSCQCVMTDHWAQGGPGAADLAHAVVAQVQSGPAKFRMLYPDDVPLWEKVMIIARDLYGADDISAPQKIQDRFKELQDKGFGKFPVCIAKTQYSFSTDPDLKGAPSHHVINIRDVRLSAGAEFVVVDLRRNHDHAGIAEGLKCEPHRCVAGWRITGLS